MQDRLVSSAGRGVRVRRLGGTRAGEIRLTRFLRNPAVTPAAMVAEAGLRLAGRCAGRQILAIQDTTVIKSEGGGGLYLHACIAVDAEDGALLGLAHAQVLARTSGRSALRRSLPMADKESQRWLDAAAEAARVCAGAASLTVIADRESDIYAAFAACTAGTHMVVRAAQDRALDDGGRLFAAADASAELGRTTLDLPARPGVRARQAVLAVRVLRAEVKRPKTSSNKGLPEVQRLTLVDLCEVDPPLRVPTVHWRLLTDLPVDDLRQALEIASLYRRRWAIEQLFRSLKTEGFDIEALRIEDEAPRCNLAMAALIATVTIQQLVHARDGNTDAGADPDRPLRPLTDAFDPEDAGLLQALTAQLEGKTARQKNPHPPETLAYAAWVCARLGGWTGYYGKPGPVVMLEGWFEFQAAKRGAAALKVARNV